MNNKCGELFDRCTAVPAADMDHEEWSSRRRQRIGGSDAGGVLGLSSYASPLTVYLEKKGLAPPKTGSPATRRGNLLEPAIRQFARDAFPDLIIEPFPYMLTSKAYPFMGANIDGVIFTEKHVSIGKQEITGLGGHEIKSSKSGYGFGEDEIPDAYYAQVQHYLGVTGLPWIVLSVYILDKEDVRHYPIYRNEEGFIADMIRREQDFWENFVVPGVMPAPLGLDAEEAMITGLFNGDSSALNLGIDASGMCAEYLELNKSIKDMEERKQAIAVEIKSLLLRNIPPEKPCLNPKANKISARAGSFSISWSRYDTKRVDTDALKRDGLFEGYSKTVESGQFRITEKKEA
ncbi:MAG: YqaJ viral recombinase family protein [Treponema sp.]|jgi:putative phage-type endonuclease|nr:YqaJ viral recombinase family protein [Treponema sp.]